MLDTAGIWRVTADPGPSAERLVAGRPVAEAREMLGRVFNLCRAAQVAGFDMATGARPDTDGIAAEIRRDHLMQIFMAWPRALGLPPALDRAWLTDDRAALAALFGPACRPPRSDFETASFLGGPDGVGPMLALIQDIFGPGTAATCALPLVDAETAFRPVAVENSPAARVSATPAMSYVEAMYGRGPLWRAMGRVLDLASLLTGNAPRALQVAADAALVPATRGFYAVRATARAGCIHTLERITPTDHLLAPGGMLSAMLERLPSHRGMLLPLLMALVDPCRPLDVEVAPYA